MLINIGKGLATLAKKSKIAADPSAQPGVGGQSQLVDNLQLSHGHDSNESFDLALESHTGNVGTLLYLAPELAKNQLVFCCSYSLSGFQNLFYWLKILSCAVWMLSFYLNG